MNYQNKKGKITFYLKKEDKVYLLTKNLKKKNKKLDYIKVRSFFIKVKNENISCKLTLFKDTKVYLVFSILLLKLISFKISIYNMFYYYA